jgi:hypothetical protein
VKTILPVGVLVSTFSEKRDEINSDRLKLLQDAEQMRDASSETVKPPHDDGIEASATSVDHRAVQFRSRRFCPGYPDIGVYIRDLPAPALDVLAQLTKLNFRVLPLKVMVMVVVFDANLSAFFALGGGHSCVESYANRSRVHCWPPLTLKT